MSPEQAQAAARGASLKNRDALIAQKKSVESTTSQVVALDKNVKSVDALEAQRVEQKKQEETILLIGGAVVGFLVLRKLLK